VSKFSSKQTLVLKNFSVYHVDVDELWVFINYLGVFMQFHLSQS